MDGYEVDMQKVFDFDIERIKQITILKDASATAIYGDCNRNENAGKRTPHRQL